MILHLCFLSFFQHPDSPSLHSTFCVYNLSFHCSTLFSCPHHNVEPHGEVYHGGGIVWRGRLRNFNLIEYCPDPPTCPEPPSADYHQMPLKSQKSAQFCGARLSVLPVRCRTLSRSMASCQRRTMPPTRKSACRTRRHSRRH